MTPYFWLGADAERPENWVGWRFPDGYCSNKPGCTFPNPGCDCLSAFRDRVRVWGSRGSFCDRVNYAYFTGTKLDE